MAVRLIHTFWSAQSTKQFLLLLSREPKTSWGPKLHTAYICMCVYVVRVCRPSPPGGSPSINGSARIEKILFWPKRGLNRKLFQARRGRNRPKTGKHVPKPQRSRKRGYKAVNVILRVTARPPMRPLHPGFVSARKVHPQPNFKHVNHPPTHSAPASCPAGCGCRSSTPCTSAPATWTPRSHAPCCPATSQPSRPA